MRWLITGAGGMLGRELVRALAARGGEVTACTSAELDITDGTRAAERVAGHDMVLNAAAYTAVDDAETDEAAAHRVNAAGPAALALACRKTGAGLVHVSTDYVFDGRAGQPYREDAPVAPASAYGRTKAAGEQAVLDAGLERGYVVRTAWLYGEHGHNFVRTMARLEAERECVEVVDDQRGQPTWARDLARALVALGASGAPPGVYHCVSRGATTWYGLARAVFAELGADPDRVRPTTTGRFPRSAPRPAYSVLATDRWAAASLPALPHWRAALSAALPTIWDSPRWTVH